MLRTIHTWTIAAATLILLACSAAASAQPAGGGEYQIGDRVECDVTGSKTYWERGTIVPFRRVDVYNGRPSSSGYFFRVRFDSQDPDEEGRVCRAVDMRLVAPPPPPPVDGGGALPMPVPTNGGAMPQPPGGDAPLPAPMPGGDPLPAPMPGGDVPPPAPPAPPADPAREFQIGDRVECDVAGGSKIYWERGIIVPFRRVDVYNGRPSSSGYFFRVRLDSQDPDEEGRPCRAVDMRLVAGPPPPVFDSQFVSAPATLFNGQATGTVMPDRELEKCPVPQTAVAKNAKPDPAVITKLIRCLWEKPSPPRMDGAMVVEVTALKVGGSRSWSYFTDNSSAGDGDTVVFPIQTDFTWRTFYRTNTRVVNFRGVFNCFVNRFSEWECGLGESKRLGEETIKRPAAKPQGAAS